MVFMAVGGWLGWFMGGCDGLLYALIAFVVIDYLTGVMCALRIIRFPVRWDSGDLQEGADLFFAGGNGEYSGCVCDREWIRAEDSSVIFLYFQ